MACEEQEYTAMLHSFAPSGTALLDWMKPKIDDSILRDIAYADYGLDEEEYFAALVPIRDEQKIPAPLRWFPREALEIMRWSEPDAAEPKPVGLQEDGRLGEGGLIWRPRAQGERGHWLRLFSCAVLLKAADDVETRDYIDAESMTLIPFVDSALRLGSEAARHALRFLSWRILSMSTNGEDYPFFAMGILLLRASLFEPGQDTRDLVSLTDWVVAVEATCRNSDMAQPVSDEWLLGLSNFRLGHDGLRRLIRTILLDPARCVPEPAASALRGIAGRIATI